ncbi:hypothetical protein AOLI_G00000290 [Acnodon oligacanthus]
MGPRGHRRLLGRERDLTRARLFGLSAEGLTAGMKEGVTEQSGETGRPLLSRAARLPVPPCLAWPQPPFRKANIPPPHSAAPPSFLSCHPHPFFSLLHWSADVLRQPEKLGHFKRNARLSDLTHLAQKEKWQNASMGHLQECAVCEL